MRKGNNMSVNVRKQVSQDSGKTNEKRLGIPLIAKVGIGCFIVLFVFGVLLSIVGRILFSKLDLNLLQKGIESKTGVKIDTSEKKGLTFTDTNSGTKVNIGEQKIPEGFPSDFPLYPNAKPSGSVSGGKQDTQGFWFVLLTPDSYEAVSDFYKTNLKGKGWITTETVTTDTAETFAVSKGNLEGTVVVSRNKDDKETSIFIALSSKER